MRRIGVGFCLATSFTIVQIFRLAVSMTRSMLPDRSTQNTTSTLPRSGASFWANTEPAIIRLVIVAIIVDFMAASSNWAFDAGEIGEVPELRPRGAREGPPAGAEDQSQPFPAAPIRRPPRHG